MPGSGPLVVRWHALELAPVEAGARAARDGRGRERRQRTVAHARPAGRPLPGVPLARRARQRDRRDGERTALETTVRPGATLRQTVAVRGRSRPGRYRLPSTSSRRTGSGSPSSATTPSSETSRSAARRAGAALLSDGVEPPAGWLERRARPARGGLRRGRRRVDRRRRRAARARAVCAGGGRHPRFRIRSSARRCFRRSSRTTRWPGCRPTGRTATSRGCSTAGWCSDFDSDLVVDAREHERAERQRNDARDDEVERVAPERHLPEKERRANRLDRG